MPILLYGLGTLCVIGGLMVAWLGFPDREFSFGNTLILTGTVMAVGGLMLVGLAAVVSRLQQLIETGVGQAVAQPRSSVEAFENVPRAGAGRIPFPPKPKGEPRPPVVVPAEMPPKAEPAVALAPTLPNPDEAPLRVAEEAPLSQPPQSTGEPPAVTEPHEEPAAPTELPFKEEFEKEWPAPERRTSFGFKWPQRKAEEPPPLEELPPEPEPASSLAAPAESSAEAAPLPPAPEPALEKPHDVAVLKSGVVDGMGYTLYVDGSIEAELPQGTLRFASINELRQHLEKNT